MGTIAEARRILERLVAFPTVSRDSNLALVDWVEDYLAGLGVVGTGSGMPRGRRPISGPRSGRMWRAA